MSKVTQRDTFDDYPEQYIEGMRQGYTKIALKVVVPDSIDKQSTVLPKYGRCTGQTVEHQSTAQYSQVRLDAARRDDRTVLFR